VDVIDSFIILDLGTSGGYRGLEIINLDNEKKIFDVGYVGGTLKIVDKLIHFKTRVKIDNESKKPKCPPEYNPDENEIGFIEEQIFDLENKRLLKTGKYECTQFE
jgi:hypothetical protein